MEKLLLGSERIAEFPRLFDRKKIGLLTNQTGIDQAFEPTGKLLLRHGFKLAALFGPEHGISGQFQDGVAVKSNGGAASIPVFSLYGEHTSPTEEMLSSIGVFVIDIQDVGSRYYTYLSTLRNILDACAKYGKPVVVLDRPNMINGNDVEGTLIESGFDSFVAHATIPVRYGLTLGELALLFNDQLESPCQLDVIPLKNWDRTRYLDETTAPFVSPSPNMATLDTAITYNGICVFEGTNISEGRGTVHPFQIAGAPFIEADVLSQAMNEQQIPGVYFLPHTFIPMAFDYTHEACGGVKLVVTDRKKFHSFNTGLRLLGTIMELYQDDLQWTSYIEIPGVPYIDCLLGTDKLRKGEIGIEELILKAASNCEIFRKEREKYLLY